MQVRPLSLLVKKLTHPRGVSVIVNLPPSVGRALVCVVHQQLQKEQQAQQLVARHQWFQAPHNTFQRSFQGTFNRSNGGVGNTGGFGDALAQQAFDALSELHDSQGIESSESETRSIADVLALYQSQTPLPTQAFAAPFATSTNGSANVSQISDQVSNQIASQAVSNPSSGDNQTTHAENALQRQLKWQLLKAYKYRRDEDFAIRSTAGKAAFAKIDHQLGQLQQLQRLPTLLYIGKSFTSFTQNYLLTNALGWNALWQANDSLTNQQVSAYAYRTNYLLQTLPALAQLDQQNINSLLDAWQGYVKSTSNSSDVKSFAAPTQDQVTNAYSTSNTSRKTGKKIEKEVGKPTFTFTTIPTTTDAQANASTQDLPPEISQLLFWQLKALYAPGILSYDDAFVALFRRYFPRQTAQWLQQVSGSGSARNVGGFGEAGDTSALQNFHALLNLQQLEVEGNVDFHASSDAVLSSAVGNLADESFVGEKVGEISTQSTNVQFEGEIATIKPNQKRTRFQVPRRLLQQTFISEETIAEDTLFASKQQSSANNFSSANLSAVNVVTGSCFNNSNVESSVYNAALDQYTGEAFANYINTDLPDIFQATQELGNIFKDFYTVQDVLDVRDFNENLYWDERQYQVIDGNQQTENDALTNNTAINSNSANLASNTIASPVSTILASDTSCNTDASPAASTSVEVPEADFSTSLNLQQLQSYLGLANNSGFSGQDKAIARQKHHLDVTALPPLIYIEDGQAFLNFSQTSYQNQPLTVFTTKVKLYEEKVAFLLQQLGLARHSTMTAGTLYDWFERACAALPNNNANHTAINSATISSSDENSTDVHVGSASGVSRKLIEQLLEVFFLGKQLLVQASSLPLLVPAAFLQSTDPATLMSRWHKYVQDAIAHLHCLHPHDLLTHQTLISLTDQSPSTPLEQICLDPSLTEHFYASAVAAQQQAHVATIKKLSELAYRTQSHIIITLNDIRQTEQTQLLNNLQAHTNEQMHVYVGKTLAGAAGGYFSDVATQKTANYTALLQHGSVAPTRQTFTPDPTATAGTNSQNQQTDFIIASQFSGNENSPARDADFLQAVEARRAQVEEAAQAEQHVFVKNDPDIIHGNPATPLLNQLQSQRLQQREEQDNQPLAKLLPSLTKRRQSQHPQANTPTSHESGRKTVDFSKDSVNRPIVDTSQVSPVAATLSAPLTASHSSKLTALAKLAPQLFPKDLYHPLALNYVQQHYHVHDLANVEEHFVLRAVGGEFDDSALLINFLTYQKLLSLRWLQK